MRAMRSTSCNRRCFMLRMRIEGFDRMLYHQWGLPAPAALLSAMVAASCTSKGHADDPVAEGLGLRISFSIANPRSVRFAESAALHDSLAWVYNAHAEYAQECRLEKR